MEKDVIFGIAGLLVVTLAFYMVWRNNKTLEGAIQALAAASNDTQANDLIEKAMTAVVPRETLDKVIDKINTGAAFAEQFTPDQVDALIEVIRAYTTSLIDGKPNEPVTPKA